MAGMWWQAEAQDIARVSDRISTLYVERCHVDRDQNAVVLITRERRVHVPAAMIGCLLCGPGSRITHAAMSLLGDSGTAVVWAGEHGVRAYASAIGPARGSQVIEAQARLVVDPVRRAEVARAMYAMRFPEVDTSSMSIAQMRGMEGARMKRIYAENSARTGVGWSGRQYRAGDAFAKGDDVNRLISAGNAALYGVAHAAVVGVGASAALGFIHTGSQVSFVLDIADLYKHESSIPLAFELTRAGRTDESEMRWEMRDYFAKERMMARITTDVLRLLGAQASDEVESSRLWDQEFGEVTGGLNWEGSGYAYFLGADVSPTPPGPNTEAPF